jgi:hypothetical protein
MTGQAATHSNLEAALELAASGIAVIPCRPTKAPYPKDWPSRRELCGDCQGNLTRPIRLGRRAVGRRESAISEWLAQCATLQSDTERIWVIAEPPRVSGNGPSYIKLGRAT